MSLKPSTVEQTKFEYSPVAKSFNKGLSKGNKKEGLFKRLGNIKNKNKEQLQAIRDQQEKQLKKLKNIEESKTLKVINEISGKTGEANKILLNDQKINDELDTSELVCTKADGTKYDFNRFLSLFKFVEKIYNYEITLDEAMDDQEKLEKLIIRLKNYKAKNKKKIEEKNEVLRSAVELFRAREDIIGFFEKRIFPVKGNVFKTKEEKSEKSQKKNQKKTS